MYYRRKCEALSYINIVVCNAHWSISVQQPVYLASRVAEHSGRSLRTNRILAHPSHSNIREHAQTCGTPITIDNFTILDSCSNTNDLRILESLYIFKDRPVLNIMQSAHPLCVVSK